MFVSQAQQLSKGLTFQVPHGRRGAFIIPNPRDPGSARILTSVHFSALATTSAGFAFFWAVGMVQRTREETFAN